MNSIIITSIICVSIIVIICIICYTNYKNNENTKSNRFFRTANITLNQYKNVLSEIDNLKSIINSIRSGVEYDIDNINTSIVNLVNYIKTTIK